MTIYIICHKGLPDYTPPDGSAVVWLNAKPPVDARGLEIIDGYSLFENPEQMHRTYSGSLGTMAILKLLSENNTAPHVTIWQYRKFVSQVEYGQQSPNFSRMRIVTPGAITKCEITNPEKSLAPNEFLIEQPGQMHTAVMQYGARHNILDFLRYSTLLVEDGFLTPEEAVQFFLIRFLAVGGIELGTYPTGWWVETYSAVKDSAVAFAERYGPCQPDDPYQTRAVAFLQERLGSFRLIRHLTQNGTDLHSYKYGKLHMVTELDRVTGGT